MRSAAYTAERQAWLDKYNNSEWTADWYRLDAMIEAGDDAAMSALCNGQDMAIEWMDKDDYLYADLVCFFAVVTARDAEIL